MDYIDLCYVRINIRCIIRTNYLINISFFLRSQYLMTAPLAILQRVRAVGRRQRMRATGQLRTIEQLRSAQPRTLKAKVNKGN